MKSITVRIPDELQAALAVIGKMEKKAMSDLVRQSLENYVKIEQFRILRKQAVALAKEKDIITDDDVFDYLK